MDNMIDEIMNDCKKIAKLHAPEVTSTEDFINWNASYTQLIMIKKMMVDGDDPTLIEQKALKLLNGTLFESRAEITNLVSSNNLKAAMDLYEQVIQKLTSLTDFHQKKHQHKF